MSRTRENTVHLVFTDELKKQIKEKAQRKGLTMMGYIRMVLIEDLKKE